MLFLVVLLLTGASQLVAAKESTKPAGSGTKTDVAKTKKTVAAQTVELIPKVLALTIPGEWPKVKPRSRIVKHEFSVPAVKGDKVPGRMTIMAAGGGIEANIARWVGQFRDAEGKPIGEKAKKVERKKVAGLEVHVVDLMGTFQDKPRGPFGPTVERPNYRMLALIVPLEKGGTWFVKLYGPQATMKGAEKPFQEMVKSLKYTSVSADSP